MANPKTVPGPVRAWIPFHKRGTFEGAVWSAIYRRNFHAKRRKFDNPDYTCRAVEFIDPRTHRVVPKRKGSK